jgi:hypothetical protein
MPRVWGRVTKPMARARYRDCQADETDESGAFAKPINKVFDVDNECELPYRPPSSHGTSQWMVEDLWEDYHDWDRQPEVHHFGPDDTVAMGKDGHFHGVETKQPNEEFL